MASSSDSTARAVHLRLVESPAEHPSTRALIEDARALDKLGRRGEARTLYEQALRSITTPSPSLASMLLRWIARSYEVDADYQAAEDCATAAVATAELGDERNALGHALNVLAAVRWRQGDLDHAEQLFHEALERGTSTTDPRLQVDVMTNLGTLASIRGDFREALRYYQDALAHGRLYSLLDNILVALNNLGMANMALGRHDAADDAFTEALTIANALGGLSTRIQLEVNSAALQIEKRDFAEAKRRCDRAMALAEHLDDARANGEAEKVYGIIARETGDLAAAEEHLHGGPRRWPPPPTISRSRATPTASWPSCTAASAATARRSRRSIARTPASRSCAPATSWPTSAAAWHASRATSSTSCASGASRSNRRTSTPRVTASASPTSPARWRPRRGSTRTRSSGSASARCCTTWAS